MSAGTFTGIPRDALGYLQAGAASPTAFYRANMPRVGLCDSGGDTTNTALQTGKMLAAAIPLVAGDLITNLSFFTGAGAGGTETNSWVALYDWQATPALLAQSTDAGAANIAASTVYTKALASPVTITKTGVYYAAIMSATSAVNTLLGSISAPPLVTGEKKLAVVSGTGLTTTADATLSLATVNAFVPLVVAT